MLPSQTGGISLGTEVEFGDYPTRTFYIDPISKQIRGTEDGLKAMGQAVKVALAIERYKYQIYTPNTGVELTGLVGNDAGYVTSELKRRVTDAFVPDRRVIKTMDFTFEVVDTDTIVAKFVVSTVYGDIPAKMEVTLP